MEADEISSLNPVRDFILSSLSRANLSGIDLGYADLSSANLTGAYLFQADLRSTYLFQTNLNDVEVKKARFGNNIAISESMKQDLIERGAIFEYSLGDRSPARI